MLRAPSSAVRGLVAVPAVLAVLAVSACSGGDEATTTTVEVDREEIVAAIAQDVIVPGYEDLATRTDELATATAELCEFPEAAAFDRAREAWEIGRASCRERV